jgi:hypothetical protein
MDYVGKRSIVSNVFQRNISPFKPVISQSINRCISRFPPLLTVQHHTICRFPCSKATKCTTMHILICSLPCLAVMFSYMFYEHARRGATVMRIFAHSFFDYPEAMMPDFGVYNEDALRRLDLALAVAARNGIRLVMVLSNYWPFTGGVQKWVDRGLGTGKDRELFYTDSSLRTKFKAFVRKIVTRTNTYTLQKYTDDPTIMM